MSGERKKLPRNLVGWMMGGAIGLLLIAVWLTHGSDLGQAELNRKAEEAKKKAEAERFEARITDPKRRTEEAMAESEKAVGRSPAASAGEPAAAPPVPVDTAATALELRKLEELRAHLGARTPPQGAGMAQVGMGNAPQARPGSASPAAPGSPSPDGQSFVMFSAGSQGQAAPSSGSADGGVLKPLTQPLGSQPDAASQPPQDARVAAAQRELDAAKAQAAAAQAPKAPEKKGDTAGERWLFDQQSAATKELPPNLVATRNRALYWLSAGTVIQAVLQSAVDTSLPGTVVARVTQPIYDSRYGQYLVLPAGSRLIGRYSSAVQDGQNRVLLAFDRLVTPAGGEVALGNMSASDALGRAGVEGELHSYFWRRMGISILLAVEGAALERMSPQQTTTGAGGQTVTGRSGSAAAQIITNTANQELQRQYAVQPKITLNPGQLVSIVTTGSIEIPPDANTR